MQEHPRSVSGAVTDVFGHRFVVKTKAGKILADLGPKGGDLIALGEGDLVTLEGEMKPTELKVSKITRKGEAPVDIEHKKKPHEHDHKAHERDADPAIATKAARDAGYAVVGEPRRKPKHFEVLARKSGGGFVELHVELDGAVRKTKPVDMDDHKWSFAIDTAIR